MVMNFHEFRELITMLECRAELCAYANRDGDTQAEQDRLQGDLANTRFKLLDWAARAARIGA